MLFYELSLCRKANLDHMRVCVGIIITAMQKMPETPNKTV